MVASIFPCVPSCHNRRSSQPSSTRHAKAFFRVKHSSAVCLYVCPEWMGQRECILNSGKGQRVMDARHGWLFRFAGRNEINFSQKPQMPFWDKQCYRGKRKAGSWHTCMSVVNLSLMAKGGRDGSPATAGLSRASIIPLAAKKQSPRALPVPLSCDVPTAFLRSPVPVLCEGRAEVCKIC